MHPPIRLDRLSVHEDRLRQAGYQQLEPFFVLREGLIKDERTGGVVKLDRSRLQLIAAIQNNRVAETGDFTPIIVGHTKRTKNELEQPPIVGKASRFEVVPFFETGTWGLRAVPWTKPQNLELYEKFPRRSAELWTNPDLLDPISLLGANTPRLDLGLHRLQRGQDDGVEYYHPPSGRDDKPIYLELDMADDKDPKSSADKPADSGGGGGGGGNGGGGGGGDKGGAVTINSPEWQQLTQTVDKIASAIMPIIDEMTGGGAPGGMPPGGAPGGMPPAPGGMPPGGAPGGAPPPPVQQFSGHPMPMGGHPGTMPPATNLPIHPGHPMQHTGHPMPQQPTQYAGHPAVAPHPTHMMPSQFNMGGGQPGGMGNTSVPTQLSRETLQGADPALIQWIQQLQARLVATENANAQLQLSMIQEHVNATLDDLESKVVIDRPRDFERLVRLSRTEQDAEIQFILATRKPIEPPTPAVGVPLHMQAGVGTAGKGMAGPLKLNLSQAHDLMEMPPDPAMLAQQAGPASVYDQLMETVRNRGKGENAMAAYEKFKASQAAGRNGAPTVRG